MVVNARTRSSTQADVISNILFGGMTSSLTPLSSPGSFDSASGTPETQAGFGHRFQLNDMAHPGYYRHRGWSVTGIGSILIIATPEDSNLCDGNDVLTKAVM
jgi:hypothetical protein